MDDYESLKHTKWECKYHVVFIPKCRRQKLYRQLRQHLGEVFRQLAQQRESQILEGHLIARSRAHADFDPAQVRRGPGDRVYQRQERHPYRPDRGRQTEELYRRALWARGYFVSTVGRDEKAIREYIQRQEQEDRWLDQMKMFD